jgi:outer membrane protein OmpA-like peptidoglycan-associated protein
MTGHEAVARLTAAAALMCISGTVIAQEAPESLKVYFDTGSASIGAEQAETLDQAARLFRDGNPIVMIVSGVADTVGSPDYNLDLSVQRAETVVQGLTDRGIPVGRLQVIGRGNSELEVDTADDVAEAENRIAEITWR